MKGIHLDAPYTRGLAEHIAGSTFDKLPATIVEHVKLFVLDTIGVGVFGASTKSTSAPASR